jgi:hypothetical protein
MLSGMLYLTGGIKKDFMILLKNSFPNTFQIIMIGGANKEYKNIIHSYLAEMRKKYSVNNQYAKFIKKHLS